jgi:hypothetical protein
MQLERNYPSKFDSAESFDPGLTTEGLVAVCGLLVLKSIKRSVINIGRSMFDVRCSTFNLFCSGQTESHTSPAAGLNTAT